MRKFIYFLLLFNSNSNCGWIVSLTKEELIKLSIRDFMYVYSNCNILCFLEMVGLGRLGLLWLPCPVSVFGLFLFYLAACVSVLYHQRQ